VGAVEDILEWSATKLTPWRQDALRRLACASALNSDDHDELLSLIKQAAGFSLEGTLPSPNPLAKEHLSAAAVGSTLQIKSIQSVKNVNRLVPSANLTFAPSGLTIIYGRNGSGKSGFVRILRTACRTRTDNPAKLKVLADVYGPSLGPQEAEIVTVIDGKDTTVHWTSGSVASDNLQQVAVFDSSAAQLYVDGGSEIKFLPFGLALPHQLNELCLALKTKLENEKKPIRDHLELATITFEAERPTQSQTFYFQISDKTTDAEINKAAQFSDQDKSRLDDLRRLLVADAASIADVRALAVFVEILTADCATLIEGLSDEKIAQFQTMKFNAIDTRKAANLDASALFSSEPLPGVGGETWRRLWLAARDYSLIEAYPSQDFPVLGIPPNVGQCVLCQQDLSPTATDRLKRFQEYVGGVLASNAEKAEDSLRGAINALPELGTLAAEDWPARIEQLAKRTPALVDVLNAFKLAVEARLASANAILTAASPLIPPAPLPGLLSPIAQLSELLSALSAEVTTLSAADESEYRAQLIAEKTELEDRNILATGRDRLIVRRDLLKLSDQYDVALAEVQTTGITRRANELIDVHLTKFVIERYDDERKALEIKHLKINLDRKSGQTKALFQTNPGTKLTKVTSDILSEGEQRALALASFLTEVGVTEGCGPIVVDDPVSSLDRERELKVATRLAIESQKRQVIVFTHDMVFFNNLCREADRLGVPTETIALFSDGDNAGRIDPAGVSWKGQNVNKRLGRIRNDFAQVKKLYSTSPTNYEIEIKNLYGRLRDAYERLVEEYIFCDVVRRGADRVETQKLRMVHLSDMLAVRFHEGMTKANTHSHDNPATETVAVPDPKEFEADLAFIDALISDLKKESAAAEVNRPSMKPK
jgi:energy-coupling factor transporter ATP-binding protein EcfA2